MNVEVSIIIPAYNVEEYIEECIYSALNQNFNNYEIIIVNDGSTDKTLEKIEGISNKSSKIKVISQENKGLSGARNTGIKHSNGKYIYFLDSDDYIHEDLIKICYEECEKNKLDLVTFDAKAFFDDSYSGEKDYSKFNYIRKNILSNKVMSGKSFYTESNSIAGYKSPVWLLFIKSSIIKENNLRFFEGIIHEDELFTPIIMSYCKKVKYIYYILFFRRIRNDSIMTKSKSEKNILGYLTVAKELKSKNIDRMFDTKILEMCTRAYGLGKNINYINLNKEILNLTSGIKGRNKLVLKIYFPILLKIKHLLIKKC